MSGLASTRLRPASRLAAALAALAVFAAAGASAELRAVDLGGIEARSAALLLSGQEAEGLEASCLARPLTAARAGGTILVVVDFPVASLLGEERAPTTVVEVYGYALDRSGQPRGILTRAFRLDRSDHGPRLETAGVKFVGALEMPAGAVVDSVRLLVLHRASGRFALRTLSLPAAGETADGARPLILEPRRPWLLVNGLSASGLEALAPAIGDAWLPATRLTASAGGRLRVGLLPAAAGSVAARLLGTGGIPPIELPVALGAPGPQSVAPLTVDFAGRSPGSYLLQVVGGERTVDLPLELVPEQLSAETAWFQRPAAPRVEEAAPPAAAPSAGRSALARLALAAYRRAFEAWQTGDLAGAMAEMRTFEARASDSSSTPSLSIEEGQVRAAAELVARDGEALVPLMFLHERLSRFYQANDRGRLATHSRRLASEFARLYAARGGREAGRIAALVPVSLAGMRQELGTRIAAQDTFERALELDPRQPAALLCLAALHESLTHYEAAVELLRRLERAGAMTPAARIRLAVNLARIGSTRQALALLEQLTEVEPGWVSRLAYQERARLLADGRRGDEALAVLVEARRRYPDDQSLTIQQAALLDALGKPLAGQRVLAALGEPSGDPGDSPRLRYSALPSREIEDARRRLAEAAAERLAAVIESARALQTEGAP